MARFLGECPTLIESFDISFTAPQASELVTFPDVVVTAETQTSSVSVSRGLWSVVFTRTEIAWDGTAHTYPIYKTSFFCMIFDVDNPLAYTRKLWPCNTVDDALFAAEVPYQLGPVINPNGLDCESSFLIDLGCPNSCTQVNVALNTEYCTAMGQASGYSFTIRAQGTRIG